MVKLQAQEPFRRVLCLLLTAWSQSPHTRFANRHRREVGCPVAFTAESALAGAAGGSFSQPSDSRTLAFWLTHLGDRFIWESPFAFALGHNEGGGGS